MKKSTIAKLDNWTNGIKAALKKALNREDITVNILGFKNDTFTLAVKYDSISNIYEFSANKGTCEMVSQNAHSA